MLLILVVLLFTFQYGEIKSVISNPLMVVGAKFTFQYGEIKRVKEKCSVPLLVDLHSSMERLKVLQQRLGLGNTAAFTFQYGEIKRLIF